MKKFSAVLVVASIIVTAYRCADTPRAEKPVFGKWKSLWVGSQNKSIDFSIDFESNNTYHVEAFAGGQTQLQKILGNFQISADTIMFLDKIQEPVQLCSFADTGKYKFAIREDTLIFKVIKDLCERRKLTLEMGLIKSK